MFCGKAPRRFVISLLRDWGGCRGSGVQAGRDRGGISPAAGSSVGHRPPAPASEQDFAPLCKHLSYNPNNSGTKATAARHDVRAPGAWRGSRQKRAGGRPSKAGWGQGGGAAPPGSLPSSWLLCAAGGGLQQEQGHSPPAQHHLLHSGDLVLLGAPQRGAPARFGNLMSKLTAWWS